MSIWVYTNNGVPPAALFQNNNGEGSPIIIDSATDKAYYYNGTAVKQISGGGSGGLADGAYGDVTVSGTGTVITINNGVVTLGKQANVASGTVFYRKTAGVGIPEVQTLATLKTDLGLTGTNSGDQTSVATLTTPRNISISGGGITAAGVAFDGSAAIALSASVDAGHVTLARMANLAANSIIGNNTGGAAVPIALSAAQVSTLLGLGTMSTQAASAVAITGGTVNGATVGATTPAAVTGTNVVVNTNLFRRQPTPTAKTTAVTLTIAELLTGIITGTSATAVSYTLPTGTLSNAGVLGGAGAVNTSFDWHLINLGSATGVITLLAGTGHTIVGLATTAISTTSRWRTRKTAANTFVTYRLGS